MLQMCSVFGIRCRLITSANCLIFMSSRCQMNFYSNYSAGKTRTKDKYRTVYSEPQKAELERFYVSNTYISAQRKAEISRAVHLSERQVKIWFQNRRAKDRKYKNKQPDRSAVSRHVVTCQAYEGHGRMTQAMASGVMTTAPLASSFELRHSAIGVAHIGYPSRQALL